jgi:hypothetical protein
MKWSREYRVCHRPTIPGGGYAVHEVYYDDDGRPTMYSKQPVSPWGDIPEELEMEMGQIIDALNNEPVNLNYLDHLINLNMKLKMKKEK